MIRVKGNLRYIVGVFFSLSTVYCLLSTVLWADDLLEKKVERAYNESSSYYHKIKGGKVEGTPENWDRAVQMFRSFVKKFPQSFRSDDARFSIGLCYWKASDYTRAVVAFLEVAEHHPQSTLADDALYLAGYSYYKQGKQEEAANIYIRLISEYPHGDQYYKVLAKLMEHYQSTEDIEGLQEIYNQIASSEGEMGWMVSQYVSLIDQMSRQKSQESEMNGGKLVQRKVSGKAKASKFKRGDLRYIPEIRFSSSATADRAVVVLDGEAKYKLGSPLLDPPRVYMDIKGAFLDPPKYRLEANGKTVKNIRASQYSEEDVRVVMEMEKMVDFIHFTLPDPYRIVMDFYPEDNKYKGKEIIYKESKQSAISLSQELGLKIRTIVIDPGHGGKDPGTGGRELKEKDIVLDIGKKLKEILDKDPSYDVYLTRDRDIYIPLEERTAFANQKGADIFISVHVNSTKKTDKMGIETYYLSFASTDWERGRATIENAMARNKMSDFEDMVKKIVKEENVKDSKALAKIVQDGLVKSAERIDRGVKRAAFVVLVGAQMPAVLTEVGFISNKWEARLLKTDSYRRKVALGLAEAVKNYASKFDLVMGK